MAITEADIRYMNSLIKDLVYNPDKTDYNRVAIYFHIYRYVSPFTIKVYVDGSLVAKYDVEYKASTIGKQVNDIILGIFDDIPDILMFYKQWMEGLKYWVTKYIRKGIFNLKMDEDWSFAKTIGDKTYVTVVRLMTDRVIKSIFINITARKSVYGGIYL